MLLYPPFLRISEITCANYFTGHSANLLVCWVMVLAHAPIFWFEIFKVSRSAVSSVANGSVLDISFPFLKKPTLPTNARAGAELGCGPKLWGSGDATDSDWGCAAALG